MVGIVLTSPRWVSQETVHRPKLSLESAGLKNIQIRSLQRYDFSSLICWLRDRRPTGNGTIDQPNILSANLASELESVGTGGYLIAEATA
jgi:hypothetical protein